MDEASIGMTVDRTEAHVSGTGKRTGVATPATGVMHGLVRFTAHPKRSKWSNKRLIFAIELRGLE